MSLPLPLIPMQVYDICVMMIKTSGSPFFAQATDFFDRWVSLKFY
jgi:hypothetical protein